MAQTILLGRNGKLYQNTGTFEAPTWALIKGVEDLTMTDGAVTAEVSSRDSAYVQKAVALQEVSVNGTILTRPTDTGYAALLDAKVSGEPIDMLVLNGAHDDTDSVGLRAPWIVTQFDRGEALREAQKTSFTLEIGDGFEPVRWPVS